MLLELRNIESGYGNKQVLFDVSLSVRKGDVVLLVGSNGSGKSTLLKAVYGITSVWGGTVMYDGAVLQGAGTLTATHTLLDRGIQYIPQKNELFDDATVAENLQYSLLHLNDRKESAVRIERVFDTIPALAALSKHRAGQLSGGERKMLGMGMAVANRPRLLLYDEPLAGLSEDNIPAILTQLGKLRADGTTLLIVEHHVAEMMQFADRTYGLRLGHLATQPLTTIEEVKEIMI